MQVLKEEIQKDIIESSNTLFLSLGFEKTSMEKIARKVGISKSNLYNYFKSKDEIFNTLTDSAALHFEKLIEYISDNKFTPKFGKAGFEEMLTKQLCDLIDGNKSGLILLISCAVGTKHEELRNRLIKIISDKFRRDYRECFSANDPIVDVITENFFVGITNLTVYSETPDELHSNLARFIRYHSKGFFELVENK